MRARGLTTGSGGSPPPPAEGVKLEIALMRRRAEMPEKEALPAICSEPMRSAGPLLGGPVSRERETTSWSSREDRSWSGSSLEGCPEEMGSCTSMEVSMMTCRDLRALICGTTLNKNEF